MRSHSSPVDFTGVPPLFTLLANAYRFLPTETAPTPAVATPAPVAAAPRPGLGERISQWLWRIQQREVESYLAQSSDVFELEARIRAVERGAVHPYY